MTAPSTNTLESFLHGPSFDGQVFEAEPMSKHTSYRIGGPAKYFVQVSNIATLKNLCEVCANTDTQIAAVGRGTNLLVSDAGFDGVVVTLGHDFRNIYTDADASTITAGASASLASVVQEALRHDLCGMEFAVGTPGTVGGAIYMNAGSATDWIGSRVASVTVFDYSQLRTNTAACLHKLHADEIEWGYRKTSFSPSQFILECELQLAAGDPMVISAKMEGSLARRKKTQPIGEPCCGSVFKNPKDLSAAKLIDDLGLKGTQIGGAQVSLKHANFIINTGNATAADVLALIELVSSRVEKDCGIVLVPEVKLLGF